MKQVIRQVLFTEQLTWRINQWGGLPVDQIERTYCSYNRTDRVLLSTLFYHFKCFLLALCLIWIHYCLVVNLSWLQLHNCTFVVLNIFFLVIIWQSHGFHPFVNLRNSWLQMITYNLQIWRLILFYYPKGPASFGVPRGRDLMVVGFITTYAISAYHH
jgi:hypothetical protein